MTSTTLVKLTKINPKIIDLVENIKGRESRNIGCLTRVNPMLDF